MKPLHNGCDDEKSSVPRGSATASMPGNCKFNQNSTSRPVLQIIDVRKSSKLAIEMAKHVQHNNSTL